MPSGGRSEDLKRCLKSLSSQSSSEKFEIIAVLLNEDALSVEAANKAIEDLGMSDSISIRIVFTPEIGFIRAIRTGFNHSNGEIVAFCDDDAIYPKDWLQKIRSGFKHAYIHGVGGPIKERGHWVGKTTKEKVSRVTWYGKHHYTVRSSVDFQGVFHVDSLPGANMAYRKEALRDTFFEMHLQFPGYSPGNELYLGWKVRKNGGTLVYDPKCVVEHYSAPWIEGSRNNQSQELMSDLNRVFIFSKCGSLAQRVCILATSISHCIFRKKKYVDSRQGPKSTTRKSLEIKLICLNYFFGRGYFETTVEEMIARGLKLASLR